MRLPLTLCITALIALFANAENLDRDRLAVADASLASLTSARNPVGPLKIDSISISPDLRQVDVFCNKNVGYISLTPERAETVRNAVRACLPEEARDYGLRVMVGPWRLEQLTTKPDIKMQGPTEKEPFVVRVDGPKAPKGLDGANIALWQSHGWYYEKNLNRWEWQRARIFQTVEDLYTQSYVMPFLMPMLENAGAYVMSPRERDTSTLEVIVDGDGALAYPGYSETGVWSDAPKPGFAYLNKVLSNNENPFRAGKARSIATSPDKATKGRAVWSADLPEAGEYAVYISYASLPESAPDARYTVHTAAGDREFRVNQRMGGGTWIYLGHFPLETGKNPVVTLTNYSETPGTVVSADAVKIGGGVGNVARYIQSEQNVKDGISFDPVTSGYPRFTEGARYWLQWAGMPDSVYTPSGNTNDYTDDYRCRGLWVNYLAGGSSMVPGRDGLKIPVDLSFAWHTDAGTTRNDSIIGTLSIYCTTSEGRNDFLNGTPRIASRRMSDLIATDITEMIREKYEPKWTRRAMWDESYYEARVPEVPAMLLELLSHQNFADMKYGLDPTFRFDVSRSVYTGMLKFLAERDGRDYVVQPLPVNSFAISYTAPGEYRLSWKPTDDPREPTAKPTYYIVYERNDYSAFREIARVETPEYNVAVTDSRIHSYKIVAANEGGVSFPSEILALKDSRRAPDVLVVNGFTRVSGPDYFDSGEIAGFYDARDHGVPYLKDISFIGSQFEFRREIPWMDDDAAGFGASRANYEDKVVAGNTFDYVLTHGEAIVRSGRSFISSSVEAFVAEKSETEPAIVDLILGKQKEIKVGTGMYGTKYKSFTPELQTRLEAYTAGGGSVFISGAYVATDLWDNPYSSSDTLERDQKFATEVLGYHWRVGQATCEGNAYEVPSRYPEFKPGSYDFSTTLNEDCYAVESPDSFYANDPERGSTILRYGENNLVAGIAYAPAGYRTVVFGFPFETISKPELRADLMAQILNFFDAKNAPKPEPKKTKKTKKSNKKSRRK